MTSGPVIGALVSDACVPPEGPMGWVWLYARDAALREASP